MESAVASCERIHEAAPALIDRTALAAARRCVAALAGDPNGKDLSFACASLRTKHAALARAFLPVVLARAVASLNERDLTAARLDRLESDAGDALEDPRVARALGKLLARADAAHRAQVAAHVYELACRGDPLTPLPVGAIRDLEERADASQNARTPFFDVAIALVRLGTPSHVPPWTLAPGAPWTEQVLHAGVPRALTSREASEIIARLEALGRDRRPTPPGRALIYFLLGRLKIGARDPAGGHAALVQALELGYARPHRALDLLAVACEDQGLWAEAVERRRAALARAKELAQVATRGEEGLVTAPYDRLHVARPWGLHLDGSHELDLATTLALVPRPHTDLDEAASLVAPLRGNRPERAAQVLTVLAARRGDERAARVAFRDTGADRSWLAGWTRLLQVTDPDAAKLLLRIAATE